MAGVRRSRVRRTKVWREHACFAPRSRKHRIRSAQSHVPSDPNIGDSQEPAPALLPPEFLAVDFFCGAGGTTRGIIDAGGYVIAGIDKEQRCKDTYVLNNSNERYDGAAPEYLDYDIFPKTKDHPGGQQVELFDRLSVLINHYRSELPETSLMFAICAPCQPFTTLARKELSKTRQERRERDSNLLNEAAQFVERFVPDMILSENVAGIGDPKYGGIWSDFRITLENLGYTVGTRLVCTSKFGIPQYRKRSILLAVRRDRVSEHAFGNLIRDSLMVPEEDTEAAPVTVESVLRRFPRIGAGEADPEVPNHRTRTLSELNLKRLAAAKPGQNNSYLESTSDGDLSLDCHRRLERRLKQRCFTDVYTRMRPDAPAPTITTRCHSISNGRFGHYDTTQVRGISLREAAALQSFPDNYVFYPTHMIEPVARMIGNAVPPKLARFFARHLVRSLDNQGHSAPVR
ncbi:DNA cytosine methyltransferase [Antarcticirhabdus aurantiaca]|uniref:DNA cytosine methyltransferase n=1 Tax=Antarcticirhabdus aurantiaca TaxID=2606717 RepID=A0ACD4NP59_9HYPH|nr:DNA cytosine methyltransferase [Antarcticirhabdus aurantiaca]WAJ28501.1 DNA cytosine methyltransferase [Jeongeuplla avenae]